MAGIYRLCSAALLFCTAVPAAGDTHSLFYTYTALSKPVDLPGIYEFIALGSLDDRELDYYNSQTQVKVPRLKWMKEEMSKDYWEKGTQSRISKEQWFKVNVEILIKRMGHNKTDLHVLQWRHGCVVNSKNDELQFLQGIDEYSYDGSEFLSFDEKNSRWIAPVQAAEQTKRKWDDVDILNQYTKSYLERECVDWLTKFISLGQKEQHSPPDVHFFVKKSVRDSKQMTLTCLATGFYSKDVQVRLGKGRTFIPEHLVTSSGVRPNGDGTYQLRKSLEIQEDERELYDCQVSHSSLKEPITVSSSNGIQCLDCSVSIVWSMTGGLVAGVLLTLTVIAAVMFVLKRTGKIVCRGNDETQTTSRTEPISSPPVFAVGSPPAVVQISPPAPVPEMNSLAGKTCSDMEKDSGAGSSKGSDEDLSEETRLLSDSDAAAASNSRESQQNIPQDVEDTPAD